MRPIAPVVYNAKRVQEKPIPKMPCHNVDSTPLDNESENEYENDSSSSNDSIDVGNLTEDREINQTSAMHSNGSGNLTEDREINDTSTVHSNGAGNSTTDQEIGDTRKTSSNDAENLTDTSATNSNSAESTNSLLPVESVYLPVTTVDEIQSDDMVKRECVYEMDPTDEVFLDGILEEESGEEHEVSNNTFEQSQNENENALPDLPQQQRIENKKKTDDSIVWLDKDEPFPMPSNATADGLIKRENDPVSGSLPYFMKVNCYTKKS